VVDFTWLHLTDLHQGEPCADGLWPTIRDLLLDDLKKIHKLTGPWDLLVFTGDLTHGGKELEFKALDEFIQQLLSSLAPSSKPFVVTVPGNHDLVRPNPGAHQVTAKDLDPLFWTNPTCSGRKVIADAFQNYSDWCKTQKEDRRPQEFTAGCLPGDFSAVVEKDGIRLGLVGLNTAYLQLAAGDYEGRLALDPRQFHFACQSDGISWCRNADYVLLLTHHPPSWLQENCRKNFLSDIYTPERFAAHLYGHMHDPFATVENAGFNFPRRFLQGRALFGMKQWGDHQQRSHGYMVGRIHVGTEETNLRIWPRHAELTMAGTWQFHPDFRFPLDDDSRTKPVTIGSSRRRDSLGPTLPPSFATCQRRAIEACRLFDFQRDIELERLFVRPVVRAAPGNVLFPYLRREPTREDADVVLDKLLDSDTERVVFIRGRAGSGKSTLLRHWALKLLGTDRFKPVYLALRNLMPASTAPLTVDDMGRCFSLTVPGLGEDLARAPFRFDRSDMHWIFLCDGLDEMLPLLRPRFLHWVESISHSAHIVVATRPGVIHQYPLGSKEYELSDFSIDQVASFVQQWFANMPELGRELLAALEKHKTLSEVAVVPLLLACLCVDVETRSEVNYPVSLREVELLTRVVEVLIDRWDAARARRPPDQRRIALGMAVFTDLARRAERNPILTFRELTEAVDRYSGDCGARDFIQTITENGRLIQGIPETGYSFGHPIFFDYFCAEALHKEATKAR